MEGLWPPCMRGIIIFFGGMPDSVYDHAIPRLNLGLPHANPALNLVSLSLSRWLSFQQTYVTFVVGSLLPSLTTNNTALEIKKKKKGARCSSVVVLRTCMCEPPVLVPAL